MAYCFCRQVKVPIIYVIREFIKIGHEYEDDDEQQMYQMPLTGGNFKRNNKLVYNMLKTACVTTDLDPGS